KRQALIHPGRPERVVAIGLGAPDDVDAERLRVAGALAAKRAASLEASSLAWLVPAGDAAPERAAALAEGTAMAAYRFDRYRSHSGDEPTPTLLERVVLAVADSDGEAVEREAAIALVTAAAANRARELQNLPANELTPEALAERARQIAAAHDRVEVDVLDGAAIAERGMGGLVAVSSGSVVEPRLITLRYKGGGEGE